MSNVNKTCKVHYTTQEPSMMEQNLILLMIAVSRWSLSVVQA